MTKLQKILIIVGLYITVVITSAATTAVLYSKTAFAETINERLVNIENHIDWIENFLIVNFDDYVLF